MLRNMYETVIGASVSRVKLPEQLYPLLETYPLEQVHMDYLTIENSHNGKDIKVLVITDHFTQ